MASPQLLQLMAEQREAFCQGFATGFVELARLQCRELALAGARRRQQAEMSATDEQAGAGETCVEASAFDNVKAKIQPQPEAECDSQDHAMEEHDGTFHAVRGQVTCGGWQQADADSAAGGLGDSAAASTSWQLVRGRWLRDHLDVEASDAIDTMKVLPGNQCLAVQRAENSEEGGEAAVRTAAGEGVPVVPAVARAAALPLSGGGDAATLDATERTKESENEQSELDKPRASCPGPAGLAPLPSECWVTQNSHADGRGPEELLECEQNADVLAGLSNDKQGDVGDEAQYQGSIGLRGASVEPLCDSGEFAGSLHPRASDLVVGGVRAAGTSADAATREEATVCGGRRRNGATRQYANVQPGLSSDKCGGSKGGWSAAEGGMGEKAQHQGSIGLGGASAEPLRDSGEFAGSSSPRASFLVVGGVRAAGTNADAATGEEATVCGGRKLTGATKNYEVVLAGLSNGQAGGSDEWTAADSGLGEEAQHQGMGRGGASAEPLCDSGEFAGSSSPCASEHVVDGDMVAGSTVDAATHEEVAVCGGRRSSEAPCLRKARLLGPQVEYEVQQLLQAVDESFMAKGLFMADGCTMQPELANFMGRIQQLTDPAVVDVEASNTIDAVAVKKRAGRRARKQPRK